jgi:hypothetical protein
MKALSQENWLPVEPLSQRDKERKQTFAAGQAEDR